MDQFGRLTLAEMVDEVRRRCDLVRYEINTVTGNEGVLEQMNRLVSNEDIKMYLNMALARRCVQVSVADNTIMADEQPIDIVAGQVEYELPPDMIFLRAVYMHPLGTPAPVLEPPMQRYMLQEIDGFNDIAQQPSADVILSYRRRLNMIVLNQVPESDNQFGLIVDYVKNMMPLLVDDQVLETPLTFVIQQVIIQDAVVEVVGQKMKLDTTELRLTQAELVDQLTTAVLNYHAPKVIQLAGGTIMAYPPGAGRRSSWQSRVGRRGWYW